MDLPIFDSLVGFQELAGIVARPRGDARGVFTTRRFGGFREAGCANFPGNSTAAPLKKVENGGEYGNSG
jgi:hypothetical protein